jgi:hypothetical protein
MIEMRRCGEQRDEDGARERGRERKGTKKKTEKPEKPLRKRSK